MLTDKKSCIFTKVLQETTYTSNPTLHKRGETPHTGPYHSTHNKNVTQVCVCPADLYTLLVCEGVRVCSYRSRRSADPIQN